jgi:hypothetical protein
MDDRVITYDGHRAFERPKTVVFDGNRHEVVSSESLFISTGVETDSHVKRGFMVRCEGGARFKLVLTEGVGWEITPIAGPKLVNPPSSEP